ncbi:hypothetical protein ACJZ2D_010138 [Fusarium nematophilum]
MFPIDTGAVMADQRQAAGAAQQLRLPPPTLPRLRLRRAALFGVFWRPFSARPIQRLRPPALGCFDSHPAYFVALCQQCTFWALIASCVALAVQFPAFLAACLVADDFASLPPLPSNHPANLVANGLQTSTLRSNSLHLDEGLGNEDKDAALEHARTTDMAQTRCLIDTVQAGVDVPIVSDHRTLTLD